MRTPSLWFGLTLTLATMFQPMASASDAELAAGKIQLDAAQIETAIRASINNPRQYAVAQRIVADESAGIWDQPAQGVSRWRLRLASPGAASISVQLDELRLPQNGQLWLHSADGRDTQGPVTGAVSRELSMPIVRGDEAIIEARMPSSERGNFALKLGRVFHGYRAIDTGRIIAKGQLGNAESCNIDVACPDGDDWRNEIRSTVLLTIESSILCSGTLVNNTLQNDRALILTAAHCGITSGNVRDVIAYFNTQKASCGATANGPINQTLRARRLLARSADNNRADYTLFELENQPPSSFNVHYAGWDISGGVPTSGVGIHHPNGDDKKISTFTSPAFAADNQCLGTIAAGGGCDGFSADVWVVSWRRGSSEGGSSGSGLWDRDHRVVGTLSGGSSECASPIPGNTNSVGIDAYARLSVGWTAPSTSGTTLKQVLDSANSDCPTLAGKNPGAGAAVNCGGPGPSPDGGSGGGGGGGVPPSVLLPFGLAALWRQRRRHSVQGSHQNAKL